VRSNKTLKYFAQYVRKIPDLDGREKQVVLRRLKRNTLEGIGKSWGLTEGRIRQIEKSALTKIKSTSRQLALFKKLKSK